MDIHVVLVIGLFLWLIVALILAFVSRQKGGKRSASNPCEIDFRRPFTDRLAAMMMALWVIVAPFIFFVFVGSGSSSAKTSDEFWPLFWLYESMAIAIGTAIYYASGPNDLFVNLDSRTYRLIHGWPHSPKVQTGVMDDIAGVFIWCRYINGDYRVGIVWKNDWKPGRQWYVILGGFNRSGRADRFAEEIMAKLNMPLVNPPSCFKSRTSLRDQ